MLNISNGDVHKLCESASDYYENEATSPLFFDKYMQKILPRMYKESARKYPYVIKVPKSIDEMLSGDFAPAREITITKPIMWGDVPIWFKDSTKGVAVKLGYENGDSRHDCELELNDKNIHMLLAGMTGMGKSVTINDIIFAMSLIYAPWEVKLTMSDPKIAEFKRYALGATPPNIESIAATGDVDYLISVVENKYKEMLRANSVFAKASCQNIKDFRKKTGLCFPQNILIFDEFQAMFKGAGKKLERLNFYIDQFGRLGRNTGYHLILASQELGSDIDKNTLNQIGVRAALGCNGKVSEQILGNDEARTIQQKGRIILNIAPNEPDNKRFNRLYRVPFQPDNQFNEQSRFLKELGQKLQFSYDLSFYDEEAYVYEKDYYNYICKFPKSSSTIYLGEPSYVVKDIDKVVKLKFTGNEIENILILNQNSKHLIRYSKMIAYNMLRNKETVSNLVLDGNPELTKYIGLNKISDRIFKLKSTKSEVLKGCYQSVYNRMLMLEADDNVFSRLHYTDGSDKTFRELVNEGCIQDTDINRSRVYFLYNLALTPEYMKNLDLEDMNDEQLKPVLYNKVKMLFASYKAYGAENIRLTRDMLPHSFIWLVGLNRIQGLGTAPKMRDVDKLKQVLLDCSEYNIRFIMLSSTLEDITEIVPGTRYAILDGTPSQEQSKLKCTDSYPPTLRPILGIYYDNILKECFKFKKMLFNGEILD